MGLDVVEFEPDPALRGVVRRCADFRERGLPVQRVEGPLVGVVLIVNLGPAMTVDGRAVGSFTAGLWDRPTRTGHDGEQAGYQMELTLGAARRLLGVPLATLANELVPLDGVLGPLAAELEDRVGSAAGPAERHAAAEAVLLRRLRAAPPVVTPPEIAHAMRRLRATGGAARVDALAAEVGWSRRHLSARMRAEVGLGPKAVGRLVRMEHAVGRLRGGSALADVAFDAGFADQPHFNREFQALVGCAPTEFPFVQDAVAAA